MRIKEPIKEIIREHCGKNIILSIFTAIYLIKLNGFNKVLLAQQELGKSNFELIAFDGGAAVVYLVIAVLIVLVAAIFVVRDFLYLFEQIEPSFQGNVARIVGICLSFAIVGFVIHFIYIPILKIFLGCAAGMCVLLNAFTVSK